MKTFRELILEDLLSNLQDALKRAETPEEIARLTNEINKLMGSENKQYK